MWQRGITVSVLVCYTVRCVCSLHTATWAFHAGFISIRPSGARRRDSNAVSACGRAQHDAATPEQRAANQNHAHVMSFHYASTHPLSSGRPAAERCIVRCFLIHRLSALFCFCCSARGISIFLSRTAVLQGRRHVVAVNSIRVLFSVKSRLN